MFWKISMIFGVCLLGAGEALPSSDGGVYVQWTALGILALAVMKLFQELASQRKDRNNERKAHEATLATLRAAHEETLDKLCGRWDEWEQRKHEDQRNLTTALVKLREHCSGKIEQESA